MRGFPDSSALPLGLSWFCLASKLPHPTPVHVLAWFTLEVHDGGKTTIGLVSISGSATNSLCWPSYLRTQVFRVPRIHHCIDVAQAILAVCLTITENAGNSRRFFSKFQLQNAISLYPPRPHFKDKRNFSD